MTLDQVLVGVAVAGAVVMLTVKLVRSAKNAGGFCDGRDRPPAGCHECPLRDAGEEPARGGDPTATQDQ